MAPAQQRGINSIETGLRLVHCLARAGRAQSLTDLAQLAGMPPSKAHRYLVSFRRAGLIEQIEPSGYYELGPLAVVLGLAALSRTDVHRMVWQELVALRDATGHTVVQAIWSDAGPVAVRIEQASRPVTVNVRPGTALSLLTTATGRVFAAFMPEAMVEPLLQREIASGVGAVHMGKALDDEGYRALIEDVRRRRIARTREDSMEGIGALSSGVFDQDGSLVSVIAIVGIVGSIDLRWTGEPARALLAACNEISRRLGHDGASEASAEGIVSLARAAEG